MNELTQDSETPRPSPSAPQTANSQGQESLAAIPAGGEMGARIRAFDWAQTPLGPLAEWPQSLRTATSISLNSRYPIWFAWGPERILLYNDAYRAVLGNKHPGFLGLPAVKCWAEIWDVIGPPLEQVYAHGEASWSEDQLLVMERNGFYEETYFTFSFSPIYAENGKVGGHFCACTETTKRVLGERRLKTLRLLSTEAHTQAGALETSVKALSSNPNDLPLVLVYLYDEATNTAHLASSLHLPADSGLAPAQISLADGEAEAPLWPLARAMTTGKQEIVGGLSAYGSDQLGPSPEEPLEEAVILPLMQPGQPALGFLVLGLSPRLPFDEEYQDFCSLVASQVTILLANARTVETEKQRAQALAEIDRAKTLFFSNVSHEFRTPLTLMLGPLEDLLARAASSLAPEDKRELELIERNGRRLLKLVNTLLDFSRIEAGRVQANYEEIDLALLTVDLASCFRSAIEKAGLSYEVIGPPAPVFAYVDREMWEKIVLNLLSNAFKYTLTGTIKIELQSHASAIDLVVTDTGAGIPAHELPRLFERFHRVEGAPGRTHEGTGIGLALVQELAKLHGGTIQVQSSYGQGSTFTVSIPTGFRHLPSERVGQAKGRPGATGHAMAFVKEAERWLPLQPRDAFLEEQNEAEVPHPWTNDRDVMPVTRGAKILLADDNADMRDYIARLLSAAWKVTPVCNGLEALQQSELDPPDLILTDVMMPGLDGFALLRALRSNPRTKTIPVIMLSARAGEESRVEGLAAGADDYLVKPFTARELMARVGANLALAQLRREAAEKEAALRQEADRARERMVSVLESIGDGFFALDQDWKITYVNKETEKANQCSREELIGKNYWALYPATLDTPLYEICIAASTQGLSGRAEVYYRPWKRWYDVAAYPSEDGVAIFFRDITDRKKTEAQREDLLASLQEADRRKDEFLAVLSHELRSPLNIIGGHAELLHMEDPHSPEFKDSLDAIVRNTKVQTQMIADLLDISRIITGKFTLDISSFNLGSVLDAAFESVRFAAQAKGVILKRQLADNIGLFVGDPMRIQQLVWNLLTNAVKFTPPRGTVTLAARLMHGNWLEIEVADTGHGINADFLPHVFDRFHQEDASNTRKYGGLGLGLSIVRHIAELHGGTAHVSSEGKGQGTSFTIELPLRMLPDPAPSSASSAPLASIHAKQTAASRRGPLAGLSILVVDDQQDARDMMGKIFNRLGARVRMVASGLAALEEVSGPGIDLMVCDIGMPEMNGLDFIKRWRELESADGERFVPAVALTAYASEQDKQRALEAGFQNYLAKPVQVADLTRLTAQLCKRPLHERSSDPSWS